MFILYYVCDHKSTNKIHNIIIQEEMESMRTRRTIRQYSDRNVPAELLNELLIVAMQASNTGNMQLYSVVVTQDAEQKKR